MEEKSKNKNIYVILIIVFIILIGLVYFLKNKPRTDNNNSNINNSNVEVNNGSNNTGEFTDENNNIDDISNLPGLIKEDTSSYNNEYVVNYSDIDNSVYYFCDKKEKNCKKKVTIKTKTNNVTGDENYKELYYFFIEDEKYKIYNIKTKETYTVNLNINFENINKYDIKVVEDPITDELVGLIYIGEDAQNKSFFSFKLNKILYNEKYYKLYGINKYFLTAEEEGCIGCGAQSIILLSTQKEKELKRIDYNNGNNENIDEEDDESPRDGSYSIIYNKNNSNYYIAESFGTFEDESDWDSFEKGNIYNKNLELLAKDVNFNYVSVDSEGYLNIADDNTVKVYDNDGTIVRTNNNYNVIMLIDDYIVTIKDKKLILATTEGKEIKLGKFDGKPSYIKKNDSILATRTGFSGVVPVAKDKYVVYVIDEEDYIAYYYIPETGKKGTTSCSSTK